jgi:hypothetical protein
MNPLDAARCPVLVSSAMRSTKHPHSIGVVL